MNLNRENNDTKVSSLPYLYISERIKAKHYAGHYAKSYFWRATQQQEIDYIEEEDGKFTAFEMKWNTNKRQTNLPSPFLKTYPVKEAVIITPENYLEWLTGWEPLITSIT